MSDHAEDQQPASGVNGIAPKVAAALERGAVLLTPNLRTARRWSSLYDAAQRTAGKGLWQPATVMPWRAWTSSLWQEILIAGGDNRILLNQLQEQALWERVLREEDAHTLRPIPALARLCQSANMLLGTYDPTARYQRRGPLAAEGTDAMTFTRWLAAFEAQCREEDLLPSAYLDTEIAAALRERRITAPKEILLYGFLRLLPAQRSVLDALEASGSQMLHLPAETPQTSRPVLLRCNSAADEMEACGRWIRTTLETQPATRIAVVVPDLQECRPELERTLRNLAAPELSDILAESNAAPYEFSTGRPMAHLPMIADALRLLAWCSAESSLSDIGTILLSPYLMLSDSPERGAEIDAFLLSDARKAPALRAELGMGAMASTLQPRHAETAHRIQALAKAAREVDARASAYAHLADATRRLLKLAGWTQRTPLNSDEHQAVVRWDAMLDRLASLDLLGGRVRLATFFRELSTLAQETPFAPENLGAPVQVMTVAEATGSTADATWFLHATEGVFPSPSSPHPLLSVALQRSLGMPGSDVSRDEEHVHQDLQHLLAASGSVTFSYAAAAPAGEQRPSPSVQNLAGLQLRDAMLAVASETPSALEEISDPAPLPALPDGVFGGGYGVLMMQAACPFRAFAEKRLFSTEMSSREAGLSQADRGTQVHNVLEAFWERTRSRADLLALTPDDRARRLEECIEIGFRVRSAGPWDEAYLRVQRERLRRLLENWLDYEASRPDFVVEAVEKKVPDAAIGPLHLELRADRIDRIGDDLVLIDYKTGAASKAEWNGDRPDQPQLPLYAIAGGLENVKALMLGFVKVGKDGMKMDGLADDPKAMGLKSRGIDFNDQIDRWAVDLPRLAEEFVWGIADAAPKDYPATCEHCAQRVLCRVDTNRMLEAEEPDLEDEEAWT